MARNAAEAVPGIMTGVLWFLQQQKRYSGALQDLAVAAAAAAAAAAPDSGTGLVPEGFQKQFLELFSKTYKFEQKLWNMDRIGTRQQFTKPLYFAL